MAGEPLRLLLRRLRERTSPPGHAGLSDAELLERFVSRRDEAALEVLFWRHGPLVWGVCRRILRHEQDAEDAFQATFLALVRKAASIGKREALGGWLYTVACRVALAARAASARRAGRELPLADDPAADGPDDPAWRDLRPVLDEEVNRLPAPYRAAVVLCYLQGLTNDEAAAALGCTRGTVASRLARARERLRRRLGARGLAPSAGLLVPLVAGKGLAAVPAGLLTTTLEAALAHAGQGTALVSAGAAALLEGALRAMSLTRLKIVLACLLIPVAAVGVCVLTVGLYFAAGSSVAAGDPPDPGSLPKPAKPQPPAAEPPREPAERAETDDAVTDAVRRAQSANNLRQIGIALHNYEAQYGHLPTPAIYGKDGKPLLSWRVAILPWLEQDNLYRQFHLDEPWDGPHNKQWLQSMPKVYGPVGGQPRVPFHTYYQAFVGKGAAFEPHKELRRTDFTDGVWNTLWVVEAGAPVPWTRPEDLPFVEGQALPKLGGLFGGDFNALFADGSTSLLSAKADPDLLRAAITRNGGEPVDRDKLLADRPGRAAGERLSPEQVSRANARLRESVEKAVREVAQLKQDVGLLKVRLAQGEPGLDASTAKLLLQHEELQKSLDRAVREVDDLRQEKARLERELSRRTKEKE
jgi:RNA polymerase sigma factor (sigma-70 family)